MDSYETVAIFAANAFPPPVGEDQGGGSGQRLSRFGILSGCRASYGLEGSLLKGLPPPQGEARSGRVPCVGCVAV